MIRSGGDVARLIAALRDADPVRRDTAIARLRIIGPRATDALTALASSLDPPVARTAALKALEGIDDSRAIETMVTLTADPDPGVAVAAIAALRPWVTRETGTRVLETLTSAALDLARDASVRVAALEAVAQLPRHLVAPLLEQAASAAPSPPTIDDPQAVLDWISSNGDAPLSDIHEVIVRLREFERQEPSPARLDHWTRARGTAHAVLAARHSTVAVYDLREAFLAATKPLPADFLTAVAALGNASCLEPMARAWTATAGEGWWQAHLAEAAAGIMRREKLTGRNAVVRKIRAKWPGFL